MFAVVLGEQVIGNVDLVVDRENKTAEVGYQIARDHWGKGLATEAAHAIVDWGFHHYSLDKIHAWADIRNTRSVQVMKRLGMTREGVSRSNHAVRGQRVDSVAYGVLRSEWNTEEAQAQPAPAIAPNDTKKLTEGLDGRVELSTERLELRPFRPDDVADVFECASDPEWAKQLLFPVPQPYLPRHADEFVAEQMLTDWSTDPHFAIVLESVVVGGISLVVDKAHDIAALGYGLARAHWGKGLVPEAGIEVVDWGFAEYGLAKIYARAKSSNVRSHRVMEKLGMTREGVLRSHRKVEDRRINEVYYGILREKWEEHRREMND